MERKELSEIIKILNETDCEISDKKEFDKIQKKVMLENLKNEN